MQSGQLDQRVELQSLTETNTSGSLSQSYATVATVAAKVLYHKGSEEFRSAQVKPTAQMKICIRYRADVTNKWRLKWAGENYTILTVDRSNRRKNELWLTAQVLGAN